MTKPKKSVHASLTFRFFCRVCGNVVYLADSAGKAYCSNKHRLSQMKMEKS